MKFTEKALIILAVIGFLLQLEKISGGTFLLAIASMLLACLYFAFSFFLLNGIRARDAFKKEIYSGYTLPNFLLPIYAGIIHAMLVFGLLLKFAGWRGGELLIFPGFVLTVISSAVWLFIKNPALQHIKKNILYRSIPLLLVCIPVFTLIFMRVSAHNHTPISLLTKNSW
jgi:hypothetical protein